jgi:hypothetical protein
VNAIAGENREKQALGEDEDELDLPLELSRARCGRIGGALAFVVAQGQAALTDRSEARLIDIYQGHRHAGFGHPRGEEATRAAGADDRDSRDLARCSDRVDV